MALATLPNKLYPHIKQIKKNPVLFTGHKNKNIIEIPSLDHFLKFLKRCLKADSHILLLYAFSDTKTCNAQHL